MKIPSIRSSAEARLLLYRLLSSKLNDVEEQLLKADPALWEYLIEQLEQALEQDNQTETATLNRVFASIDNSTKEGLHRQFEKLSGHRLWLGVFPSGLLDAFIDEHTKLIKGLQREQLDKIGFVVKRGVRQGLLAKDITRDIIATTNISKKRAQLIARCAPLQYSGELTRHHQKNAGITRYRWQTSGDERVRASHKSRDGKIYSWDDPGPHPRSEIRCRCDAIPVLE